MFSGIVESKSQVIHAVAAPYGLKLRVARPGDFQDLKLGDSVAVNGVCLTLSASGVNYLEFDVGPETLRVTGWTSEILKGQEMNLERSLRLGDRLHGHFVTGHVDESARVVGLVDEGGCRMLHIQPSAKAAPFLWTKGSVALSGVSLTVNGVDENGVFTVTLIPETLRRTNLSSLSTGSAVNLEYDFLARSLFHRRQAAEAPL